MTLPLLFSLCKRAFGDLKLELTWGSELRGGGHRENSLEFMSACFRRHHGNKWTLLLQISTRPYELVKSSQIINHQQCVLHFAKSESSVKNINFLWLWYSAYDYSTTPAGFFKPAGLTICIFLFLSLFHLLIWHFWFRIGTFEVTVPYRSSAQIFCRVETSVFLSRSAL
jgi:hypothetical protein